MPTAAASTPATMAVLDLLTVADDELLELVGRWYIARRELRFVRRNALVVLGNTAARPVAPAVAAVLRRYLSHADPMLRGHAVWAARRLDRPDLAEICRHDPEPSVQLELARVIASRAGSSEPSSPPAGASLR